MRIVKANGQFNLQKWCTIRKSTKLCSDSCFKATCERARMKSFFQTSFLSHPMWIPSRIFSPTKFHPIYIHPPVKESARSNSLITFAFLLTSSSWKMPSLGVKTPDWRIGKPPFVRALTQKTWSLMTGQSLALWTMRGIFIRERHLKQKRNVCVW